MAPNNILLPEYQRPYVWGSRELEELWTAIINAVSDNISLRRYFLGVIALTQRPQPAGSVDQWAVLDGGQRLTSLLLLLCALRDHGVVLGLTSYDQITNNYLVNQFRQDDLHCKLVLTPRDREAFQSCVGGKPDLQQASPITEAYQFFRRKIQDSYSLLSNEYFDRTLEAILHNIEFVAIVADDETLFSLYSVEPARLRGLIENDESAHDVVAVAGRRQAVQRFRGLLEDAGYFDNESVSKFHGKAEAVWQALFEANAWIFGVSLAGQLLTSWNDEKLEQVVAGPSIVGVGKRADALLRTVGRIRSMVFVECKTHRTPLLGAEYRPGCWSPSNELVGGVAQLQGTIYRAVNQIGERLNDKDPRGAEVPGESIFLIRPRLFLVIGQLDDLMGSQGGVHLDRLRSFELYRRNISEPEILTFDELLARADWSVPPPL